MDRLDNDGIRLPIKIASTSNGEYEPITITTRNEQGNKITPYFIMDGGY